MKNYLFYAIAICFMTGEVLTPYAFSQTPINNLLGDTLSSKYDHVLVEEVLNIDTIKLKGGEKVKMIGLRPPEVSRKKDPVEKDKYGFVIKEDYDPNKASIEDEAFYYVQNLLEGKYVRLEFDSEKKDEDFRTLAYVFLKENNLFVNTEIIRNGYAHLQIRPPNTKYDEQLRTAYKEARDEMRGLQSR